MSKNAKKDIESVVNLWCEYLREMLNFDVISNPSRLQQSYSRECDDLRFKILQFFENTYLGNVKHSLGMINSEV